MLKIYEGGGRFFALDQEAGQMFELTELECTPKSMSLTPPNPNPYKKRSKKIGDNIERLEKLQPVVKHEWSRKHAACVHCNTTDHKHKSVGLCTSCYTPTRAMLVNQGIDTKKTLKGDTIRKAKGIDSSVAKEYQCNDCGEVFKSVLSKVDAFCPACKSVHVTSV